jgi:hypothetical protein
MASAINVLYARKKRVRSRVAASHSMIEVRKDRKAISNGLQGLESLGKRVIPA